MMAVHDVRSDQGFQIGDPSEPWSMSTSTSTSMWLKKCALQENDGGEQSFSMHLHRHIALKDTSS
jgi:hypothetical protein